MSGDALIDPKTRMAQLSVSYVHAIASYCGFGADVPSVDHDSVDITVSSSAGKKPKLDIQLKATTQIDVTTETEFSFPLTVKNYNELRGETMSPRILVVLCMSSNQGEWVKHSVDELAVRKCAYWISLQGQPETANKENISIRIPTANMFSPEALSELMQKAERREDI